MGGESFVMCGIKSIIYVWRWNSKTTYTLCSGPLAGLAGITNIPSLPFFSPRRHLISLQRKQGIQNSSVEPALWTTVKFPPLRDFNLVLSSHSQEHQRGRAL
jgi:hypothetical protein